MPKQRIILLMVAIAMHSASMLLYAQAADAPPVGTNIPLSVNEPSPQKEPSAKPSVEVQPSAIPATLPEVHVPRVDIAPSPAPTAPDREPEPLPEQELQPLGGSGTAGNARGQSSGTGVGSWGLQTAMALGVVVLLVVILRMFLRRLGGTTAPGGVGLVEVLARVPIAPKTHVLFLRIGERVIIAGQTAAGLNTLATFDEPEDVASVLAHVQAAKPASITEGFSKLMRQFDRGYHEADDEGRDTDEHVVDRTRNDVSGLLSRIRNLNRHNDG